jgi:hypothetical protein
MIHHIQERWLIELETKLHLVTLKSDRLTKRLNAILSAVDEVCHKDPPKPPIDTPIKTKHRFINTIRNKLANKRGK